MVLPAAIFKIASIAAETCPSDIPDRRLSRSGRPCDAPGLGVERTQSSVSVSACQNALLEHVCLGLVVDLFKTVLAGRVCSTLFVDLLVVRRCCAILFPAVCKILFEALTCTRWLALLGRFLVCALFVMCGAISSTWCAINRKTQPSEATPRVCSLQYLMLSPALRPQQNLPDNWSCSGDSLCEAVYLD